MAKTERCLFLHFFRRLNKLKCNILYQKLYIIFSTSLNNIFVQFILFLSSFHWIKLSRLHCMFLIYFWVFTQMRKKRERFFLDAFCAIFGLFSLLFIRLLLSIYMFETQIMRTTMMRTTMIRKLTWKLAGISTIFFTNKNSFV